MIKDEVHFKQNSHTMYKNTETFIIRSKDKQWKIHHLKHECEYSIQN